MTNQRDRMLTAKDKWKELIADIFLGVVLLITALALIYWFVGVWRMIVEE